MNRKNKLVDILFFMTIVISGLATNFSRQPIGIIIVTIIAILLFSQEISKFAKTLITPLIIWSFYILAVYISLHTFYSMQYLRYICYIFLGCAFINHYGSLLFLKYLRMLYFLALISLFFYAWENINRSSLSAVLSTLDVGGVYGSKNIIVYNMSAGFAKRLFLTLNCGFCWEPGPYGCFLSVAIYCAILLKDVIGKTKFRKYLTVLLLALITTQSSTAYSCLLLVLLWAFSRIVRNQFVRVIAYPIIIAVTILLFFSVDVLSNKITEEFSGLERSEETIKNFVSGSNEESISLGRFSSFHYDWLTLKKHPLFGTCGDLSYHYLSQYAGSIAAIGGLGKILCNYGIFGATLFLLGLFKSSRLYSHWYSQHRNWCFIPLILMNGFSFAIIETPLYFTIYMAGFLYNPLIQNRKILNEI